MINLLFPLFNALDAWLFIWIPPFLRICLWGAISGAGAIVIYALLSNQKKIRTLKLEAKELRTKMFNLDLEHAEYMCQVKLNLLVSLRLLTEVIFPSLISSIPVLAIMLSISSMYHYETPLPGSRVDINIHASMTEIDFAPKELFIFDGQNTHFIVPDQPSEINILYKGRVVYKGNPLDPPTKRISKKVWWNTIIGSEVGYVRPGTPVEEIAFNYPRRRLLSNVPFWLSTWELPFFAFLTIAAVILKFAFHIK